MSLDDLVKKSIERLPDDLQKKISKNLLWSEEDLGCKKSIALFEEGTSTKINPAKFFRHRKMIVLDRYLLGLGDEAQEKVLKALGSPTWTDYMIRKIIHEIGHAIDTEYQITEKKNWRLDLLSQKNGSVERRLNQHENKNRREFFAENFEKFILDPDFICRRPEHYRFFSDLFQVQPFPAVSCQPVPFVGLDHRPEGPRPYIFKKEKLAQIRLLTTTGGEKLSNQLGHSMLELAFLGPDSKDATSDKYHRVIVNFNGLTGPLHHIKSINDHPSPGMITFHTFREILDDYTGKEDRDLLSIPLNLTQYQRERILLWLTYLYWGFEPAYDVMGNNCSHGVLKAVAVAFDDQEDLCLFQKDLNPLLLIQLFVEKGLIDPEHVPGFHPMSSVMGLLSAPKGKILGSREDALTSYRLYPRRSEAIGACWKALGDEYPLEEGFSGSYKKTISPKNYVERREILGRLAGIIPQESFPSKMSQVLSCFALIEDRNRLRLEHKGKKREETMPQSLGEKEARRWHQDMEELAQVSLKKRIKFLALNMEHERSYGIPLVQEVKDRGVLNQEIEKSFFSIKERSLVFQNQVKAQYPDFALQLEGAHTNLYQFTKTVFFLGGGSCVKTLEGGEVAPGET
jgi:hypothetical protein